MRLLDYAPQLWAHSAGKSQEKKKNSAKAFVTDFEEQVAVL